jgi:putative membrane protein
MKKNVLPSTSPAIPVGGWPQSDSNAASHIWRTRMTHFLVTWAITALGLLIISQLRLGIEIKNIGTSLVAALVLGVLNAILRPILGFFALPITILTLGLFALVLNALMIMLMAALVQGVHLRNGFWSALIGSILLGIFNAIVTAIIF